MPSRTSFDSGVPDLDNWFNNNFSSLSPVHVDPLDDTQGLDLGFYTYPASEDDTSASRATEPLAAISCKSRTRYFAS